MQFEYCGRRYRWGLPTTRGPGQVTRAEYLQYLQSFDWRTRRVPLIKAHGSRCHRCHIPQRFAILLDGQELNFHHTNYAKLGRETPEDGHPLCRLCHRQERNKWQNVSRTAHTAAEWDLAFRVYQALRGEDRKLFRELIGG